MTPSNEIEEAEGRSGGASVPSADEFIRSALVVKISEMLTELQHPPLVDKIFPLGWQKADRTGLINLYELCRRTFAKRERTDTPSPESVA